MALVPVNAVDTSELSEASKDMLKGLDHVRGLVLTGRVRGVCTAYTAEPDSVDVADAAGGTITGVVWRVAPGVNHLEMLGLLSQTQHELCSSGTKS